MPTGFYFILRLFSERPSAQISPVQTDRLWSRTDGTSYFKNDEVIKVTTNNRFRWPLLLIALLAFSAAPVAAQSPNTATMIVVVVDQTGAVGGLYSE
jgi:hypothetical protein